MVPTAILLNVWGTPTMRTATDVRWVYNKQCPNTLTCMWHRHTLKTTCVFYIFCRSVSSSFLLNQMTMVAILWMEGCFANLATLTWFLLSTNTNLIAYARWETLYVNLRLGIKTSYNFYQQSNNEKCHILQYFKPSEDQPILLLHDNFALYKYPKCTIYL